MLSTASNLTDDLLLKAVDAAGQRAITKASLSKCTVVNGTVPLKACAQVGGALAACAACRQPAGSAA